MDRTVEILLATYHGEEFVGQQIDSILSQSYRQWHLTISDDGSTDGTLEIVDTYARKYPDRIEKHVSGCRFGNARDHFFYLMNRCHSRYLLFCDQDDIWYPDKVQKLVDAIQEAEKIHGEHMPLLVFSDQTPTDAQLRPLAPSLMRYQNQYFEHFDYRSILMQNVVTGGAMCINRALADLAGQCVKPSQTMMHDWWIAVVAARFGKVIYIDEPLSDYRQHESNSVGAKNVRSMRYVRDKLVHLKDAHQKMLLKKRQALIFRDTYRDCEMDEDFFRGFIHKRSGIRFYWRCRELIHGHLRLLGMMLLG